MNDLDLFLEQHPLHQLYGGEHAYLLKQYVSAINQAGFNTIEVISPWQSPLNFAPYTLESLKTELVTRSGIKQPVLNRSLRALLDAPIVWPLLRSILDKIDHRPGRLYSFIAKRN